MKQKIVKGYKFVTQELKSRNGNLQWKIGEWQTCKGKLQLCENGLHASPSALESLQYTYGDRWFKVVVDGECLKGDDKFVARKMMLVQELPVREILVKFAVACARRCYNNWEKQYPEDKRVLLAIEAAEAYVANPTKETASAAWIAEGAARSAESAESAAWSAAWSAARKWQHKTLNKLIQTELKKQKSTLVPKPISELKE
jgi:hypothetical protein